MSDAFFGRIFQVIGRVPPFGTVSMTTYFHASAEELRAHGTRAARRGRRCPGVPSQLRRPDRRAVRPRRPAAGDCRASRLLSRLRPAHGSRADIEIRPRRHRLAARADRRGGDDRRAGRQPAGERAAAAGRDRGGAGRAARPPGRAPRPPFAGVSRPARRRGARARRARQRRAAARAAAAVAPAAAGRGQGLLRRAGAARPRAGRRGHDLGLDRRAGEVEEDRRRPAVLGRLHDSRPSLARPRFRRPA